VTARYRRAHCRFSCLSSPKCHCIRGSRDRSRHQLCDLDPPGCRESGKSRPGGHCRHRADCIPLPLIYSCRTYHYTSFSLSFHGQSGSARCILRLHIYCVVFFLWLSSPDRLRKNLSRSEEHTSELQSRFDLVCRLLLEKKKRELPCSYAL